MIHCMPESLYCTRFLQKEAGTVERFRHLEERVQMQRLRHEMYHWVDTRSSYGAQASLAVLRTLLRARFVRPVQSKIRVPLFFGAYS